MALVTLIRPFAALRGTLKSHDSVYTRMLNGKCVMQRKPDRSSHIPTPAETANRQRFGAIYGTARRKHPPPP